MNNRALRYDDIMDLLPNNHVIVGDIENIRFTHSLPIVEADEDAVAWISPERKDQLDLISSTRARVIFIASDHQLDLSLFPEKTFVLVPNVKLTFQRLIGQLFHRRELDGIHPMAFIHPDAIIGTRVSISAFTYVGRCRIGDGSVIYGNCYIHDHVIIGKNVIIHSGTVIGADGFGLTRNERGELENFPHIGGVIIEDDVEIGANTCIDRGTLGNTHIKAGAKIDNLVHVAHNVEIGHHSAVVANTMIGGSTRIADYSWIAPSATLRDRIRVGNNATVGLGAVVTRSIPDQETWMGNPAKQIDQFKQLQKKLSEL